MKIALVHNHYSEEHLAEVIEQMKALGAPKIHAVYMECHDHWQALEGCHRIRAAKELGLIPEIIEVEYSDNPCSSIPGYDGDCDYMVSEICDDVIGKKVIEFEV
jgi:hypothetical protein